jgi:electron transfer flavoprotein alpha subunit
MSNGLLVFIEHKGGTANRSSIEAIAAAQALGSQLGQKVSAVVLGADVASLAQEIAAYDLEKVICGTRYVTSLRSSRRALASR